MGELEAVRLEVRLEEFERRLRARSIELETELKSKERLRERVRELTTRVDDLTETASALHREAASATSLARELDETLKVAAEARHQLGAALEAERARRIDVESDAAAVKGALSARADELLGETTRLSSERAALLARAGAAEQRAEGAELELASVRADARELAARSAAQDAESRRRDEELAAARRGLSQLRQKVAGHEAHIESLRSDLQEAVASRELSAAESSAAAAVLAETSARVERAEAELVASRERVETLGRELAEAQAALGTSAAAARVLEDEGRRQRTELDSSAELRQRLEAESRGLREELARAQAAGEDFKAATANERAIYEAMKTRVDKNEAELLAARARAEELSRSMHAAQSSLEQARLLTRRSEDEARRLQGVIDGLQNTFDERQAAEEAKSRAALESAEQVRREGVEAFEKAHDAQLRQDLESERVQKELAAGARRLTAESESIRAKAEKLKQELRARADREVAEMRLALDEERARLYADVEAERAARGKRAAPPPDEDANLRDRDIGEARRRQIAEEVQGYLTPVPKSPAPGPEQARLETVPLPPLFRWDEEMRLLLYVAIVASVVGAIVASVALYYS